MDNTIFSKKNQRTLKAEYRTLMADVWQDQRMIDFCTKNAEIVVKTEDGFFLELEKQSIQNNFCFGYYGSDDEAANKMSHHARTNENYFIEENLKSIKKEIEYLSTTSDKLYFRNHYTGQGNDILKGLVSIKPWEEPAADMVEVSENNKNLLIEAYKMQLESQTKKVNTYLKRYGLSKVRSWSYWVDA